MNLFDWNGGKRRCASKARDHTAAALPLRAGGFDRFSERKVAVYLRCAPVALPVEGGGTARKGPAPSDPSEPPKGKRTDERIRRASVRVISLGENGRTDRWTDRSRQGGRWEGQRCNGCYKYYINSIYSYVNHATSLLSRDPPGPSVRPSILPWEEWTDAHLISTRHRSIPFVRSVRAPLGETDGRTTQRSRQ